MSDEQTNSETPDGGTTGDAGDPGELMTRGEARKLIDQRQTLKATNAELLVKLAAQEATIAEMSGGKPDGAPTPVPTAAEIPGMPDWAQDLRQQVTELGSKLDTHQTSTARAAVEAAVLSDVPDGNHLTAKALLGTLGVDFTQPGAAADALAILREQHSAVMVDHTRGSQPRAPATKADGSPDFASYKTFDEVPDAFKPAVMRDPETFKRLRGGGSQSHGLNI
jgi:hypothetical protein